MTLWDNNGVQPLSTPYTITLKVPPTPTFCYKDVLPRIYACKDGTDFVLDVLEISKDLERIAVGGHAKSMCLLGTLSQVSGTPTNSFLPLIMLYTTDDSKPRALNWKKALTAYETKVTQLTFNPQRTYLFAMASEILPNTQPPFLLQINTVDGYVQQARKFGSFFHKTDPMTRTLIANSANELFGAYKVVNLDQSFASTFIFKIGSGSDPYDWGLKPINFQTLGIQVTPYSESSYIAAFINVGYSFGVIKISD